MKKAIAIILMLVLIVSISACSSDKATQDEPSSTPPQTALDAFVYFSDYVGKKDYSECQRLVSEWGLEHSASAPTKDESGKIIIKDGNPYGFRLNIWFSPDSKDVDTITLLSYENGNYEGAVSDSFHSTSIKYNIYDVAQEPKNKEVASLDEVISFIQNDVPQKTIEYNKSTSENEMIEVEIEAEKEVKGGKAYFTIKTNLPDNTSLMFTLKGSNSYMAQTQATVKNGEAKTEGFSNKGNPLSGHYSLEVSTPLPKLQDKSVTAIIGTKGEFLTGKYIEYNNVSDCNLVSATFSFDF